MIKVQEKPAYISREEKNGITQDLVNKLFDYRDGFLYRKIAPNSKTKVGEKAGWLHSSINRHSIGINDKYYLSSRIIFIYHNGYLPQIVDHKDRNTLNDKIENLRAATRIENNRNSTSRKNSTSQYLGVSLNGKRWIAIITYDGKTREIGRFDTEIEAALAYNREAEIHFKEFANFNIIKP